MLVHTARPWGSPCTTTPHSGLGNALPWLQFPHLLCGAGEPRGLTQQALLCSWTTDWGQGDSSDSWEDTSQLTGTGGPA